MESPERKLRDDRDSPLEKFRQFTVGHMHLKNARDQLLSVIREPGDASLVIVVGPSGAGKTTLLKSVEAAILREHMPMMMDDRGYLPIKYVENPSPHQGQYDWRDFFTRCLESMEEPLIDLKVNPETPAWRSGTASRKKVDGATLRRSLESTLYHRQVHTFLIDEAQHFTKVTSAKRMLDQLDTLKSIANLSKCLLVLTGTYELLPFTTLSGQLSRRSIVIHLQRYHANVEDERTAFQSTILALQEQLPLPKKPNLVERWDYLYLNSAGCIGILKNWLTWALKVALDEGQQTITDDVLSRTALSKAQVRKLAEEINVNEALFNNMMATESDEDLVKLLGFPGSEASEDQTQAEHESKPKPKPKPGQRKPKRDTVGIPEELMPAESM